MRSCKITVTGLVQGIGYRPFVAELAAQLHIAGTVRNAGGIVIIEACGNDDAMRNFLRDLKEAAPKGARVQEIRVEETGAATQSIAGRQEAEDTFCIVESTRTQKALPFIPADLATCDRCRAELLHPANRRFHHGFISCVSCGPRYSILEALPYDRARISMKKFPFCAACEREYHAKQNIRRYAQTICCPNCGPAFTWKKYKTGVEEAVVTDRKDAAIACAGEFLRQGGIVAMKDVGGYHLVCDPWNEEAVQTLRRLKNREAKPFAICFPDTEAAACFCEINETERDLLESAARPIVLLQKKTKSAGQPFPESVCGRSSQIGAILPCDPQQILLTMQCGPLIMTSGNASGDLLCHEDAQMEAWIVECQKQYPKIMLGMLSHDRPIVTPLDDSIVRVMAGRTMLVRRARGYVPLPIDFPLDEAVFAAGGDLKASFAFVQQRRAYLGAHLGDLCSLPVETEYIRQAKQMQRLFDFTPKRLAVDAHPGYLSGKLQQQVFEKSTQAPVKIQHHKAHVASVAAEHALRGDVIGFAFDGTGFGTDAAVWGSEIFVWNDCDKSGQDAMQRVGHLKPVTLIGGDEGARNADVILLGYLANQMEACPDAVHMQSQFAVIRRAIETNIHTITSTSMGRLFDAVSALLDVCHYNSYEGEAPMELEYLAGMKRFKEAPAADIAQFVDAKLQLDGGLLLQTILEWMHQGWMKEQIARKFIDLIADYIVYACEQITSRRKKAQNLPKANYQVVLSGGTFQNRLLLEQSIRLLEARGYQVYVNEQVPCTDGGICLGQAYLSLLEKS